MAEQDVRLCRSVHQNQPCIRDNNHGGTEHESASGLRWPMHLPYVQKTAHCGTCTCRG